ncbi:NADPH-dependent FMN reductase [Photobacterium sp. OFAV2-7]|uniref:NADPH-dependent FMN reductase n=1 Tax=Photobacterium sp. OFAV2-7 TaxID=2917748 RepID=UPI001EF5D004|nr:NAD(P)H-dependent oxidoreductase [Photobacterium sp. OFAV2-7]MCG7587495.1 NAD(P)H-dependent oxidoreductase [Photobacterium sp. OFAV2-7]
MKKILAFSGSNHSQSIHNNLVRSLAAKVTQNEVTIIDLKDFDMPMYGIDEESQGIPTKAFELRQIMNEHDALVIASPEHNGSMPAFLKNVIDWLSRAAKPGQPFFGDSKKPVLLVSTSPGPNGGATNLKTMTDLMPWWGGDVKATFSLGSYQEKFSDGDFDVATQAELDALMASFEKAL